MFIVIKAKREWGGVPSSMSLPSHLGTGKREKAGCPLKKADLIELLHDTFRGDVHLSGTIPHATSCFTSRSGCR